MNKITIDSPEFKSWFTACQKLVSDDHAKNFPNLFPDVMRVDDGRRYIKIVSEKYQHVNGVKTYIQSLVWAFIDKTNGDVLKPATWKSPAKGMRGNLFDSSNGLSKVGPWGPKYL